MDLLFLLFFALEVDTNVSIEWLLGSAGVLLLLIGGQWLKFYLESHANKKLFSDITLEFKRVGEANDKIFKSLFSEMEHVRLRHSIELKAVKEAHEKEINYLRAELKEVNHEVRELRDMIIGLSKSVDLWTLSEMKTHKRSGKDPN